MDRIIVARSIEDNESPEEEVEYLSKRYLQMRLSTSEGLTLLLVLTTTSLPVIVDRQKKTHRVHNILLISSIMNYM
jgi:hypothetical protein